MIYYFNTIYGTIKKLAVGLAITMVRGYRILIGPMLPQSCRFYPSCSAYSM